METQISVIDIVATVRRGISTQSIGEGRVFEITPIGDDIVFIIPGPDIGLYREDHLLVLRIGDAGKDTGDVGLTVLTGIKSEIGAKNACKTRLKGISYHGQGGNVELSRLLKRGVLAESFGPFQEAASKVHQV